LFLNPPSSVFAALFYLYQEIIKRPVIVLAWAAMWSMRTEKALLALLTESTK
jgi:hypothetical protein